MYFINKYHILEIKPKQKKSNQSLALNLHRKKLKNKIKLHQSIFSNQCNCTPGHLCDYLPVS